MYIITRYNELYRPTNTKGGELVRASWVKLPVKPRGKGLRALLRQKDGHGVLGVWVLLLQASTETERPELRGMLLNHKDEPASVEEIADAISMESNTELVTHALEVLCELGWIASVPDTDLVRSESVGPPYPIRLTENTSVVKSRVVKSRVEKGVLSVFDPPEFKEFVDAYPKTPEDCAGALEAWEGAPEADRLGIVAGAKAWAAYWACEGTPEKFINAADSFITKNKWRQVPPKSGEDKSCVDCKAPFVSGNHKYKTVQKDGKEKKEYRCRVCRAKTGKKRKIK